MKILITGYGGQAANAIVKNKPLENEVIPLGHSKLDITDRDALFKCLTELRPDVLVNTAAYTNVDRAESEPDLAFRVNADAVGLMASMAADTGVRLIHISTDFVFDGRQSRPYQPLDTPNPLNVYGASKLAGERQITDILGEQAVILRTSWVYSSTGSNFVNKMVQRMKERQNLRVVSDQVGSPTWASSLAVAVWAIIAHPDVGGIHHWCDAGVASWYDFSIAISEEAYALGILQYQADPCPIMTQDYPTPAVRPAYSVLNRHTIENACGIRPPHWRINLRNMLRELANA